MKVLIAESDRIPLKMLEATLVQWGHEVRAVEDGEAAWEVLQRNPPPELALVDWNLPNIDGLELCRRVRARGLEWGYTYMVLLTTNEQRKTLSQGIEAGADDHLDKPVDREVLGTRLLIGQRLQKVHEELRQAKIDLQHELRHDALTGLWNRVAILELLGTELQRCRREDQPLSVLLADLDHFKNVNDVYGHLAGDAILQKTAQLITETFRPYDLFGRYGEEQFLVVLPTCSVDQAEAIAERFRQAVAFAPFSHDDNALSVTLSCGVATSEARSVDTVQRLLHRTDQALNRAKDQGRNRVVACT